MKKLIKTGTIFLSLICFALFGCILYGEILIPDKIDIVDSDANPFPTFYKAVDVVSVVENSENTSSEKFNIRFLDAFHVKEVELRKTERKYVKVLGNAFGIKIYTDGVLIVRIDDVVTDSGIVSPGKEAGLKEGDVILKIDDQKVETNNEVAEMFMSGGGNKMKILVKRDTLEFETFLTAAYSSADKKFRAGIWVRDSSAGIGTMTYFDPDSNIFCGLGHAVCDVDTGRILTLSGGEAVDAVIKGSYKGKSGNPGELCGLFGNSSYGKLVLNSKTGVYGVADSITSSFGELPVGMHYEVEEGSASILSEIDENGVQSFDINIIKLFGNSDSQEKNMVIEVVDEDLLRETGGIVQGMSGSPVIQNGMLVGAITHVLVNDPAKGYAVFAENMLKTEKTIADS